MCGIVGILGTEDDVAERLLDGLKRLEYRGYDSAGICTVHDGDFDRRRAPGQLVNLQRRLREEPLPGRSGTPHTRWAPHGAPPDDHALSPTFRYVLSVTTCIASTLTPAPDTTCGQRRLL